MFDDFLELLELPVGEIVAPAKGELKRAERTSTWFETEKRRRK
jgi:hypothetical protein